jgi:LacI family transcriptional regulator
MPAVQDEPRAGGYRVTTLRDVARAASVSMSTASRVLAGSSKPVNDDLRERVRAAAAMLGYVPNSSAQAVALGTAPIVTLLVSDLDDPYFGRLSKGVLRGADEAGLLLTLADLGKDGERADRLVGALRAQRPRGVIVAAPRRDGNSAALARELRLLSAAGTRVVAIGETDAEAHAVPVGNLDGARALGAAMARQGYASAFVVAAPEGVHAADQRASGFAAGFISAGGHVRDVYRDDLTRVGGERATDLLLYRGVDASTVVFCVADVMALGAAAAMRARGLRIGVDVGLCGFGEIPSSLDVTPALTTVRLPLEQIGRDAVRACLDEPPTDLAAREPEFELHVRESTAYIS